MSQEIPTAVHQANWLGLAQAQPQPNPTSPSFSQSASTAELPAKPRVRFSRAFRSSTASNDDDRIGARSVVRFEVSGGAVRIGLVIREPVNGMATVRIQGSSRTMEVAVDQLTRYPDLPVLGVSRECLSSFREAHAELLENMDARMAGLR